MSTRAMLARLDRLAAQIPLPEAARSVCRWHDTHCELGRNWPLPYPYDPDVDGVEWARDHLRAYRAAQGEDVGPHPRELWERGDHEQVPQAELDQEAAELQVLIEEAQARVALEEAMLRGDGSEIEIMEEWL